MLINRVAFSPELLMENQKRSEPTDRLPTLPATRPIGSSEDIPLLAPTSARLMHELQTLADLKNYHRWIFDEICPFLGTELAEIGGGIGTFSEQIIHQYFSRNINARLEIFEPTDCLFNQLERNLRQLHGGFLDGGTLTITAGNFRTDPRRYDSILLINVLEHVQHEYVLLQQIHESLQSTGVVIIFVPSLRWLYSELDKQVGHYRRYEQDSLRSLLERNGFTVVKTKYMDILGVLPWYVINVLGKSASFNPFLARLYDRCFVPATRRIEEFCKPVIGKNLLMVGRKYS